LARILIADDEDSVRHFLKETVQRMGHEAIAVTNGQEALEIFKNDPIDLSLVDIKMPKMDGLRFLHKAKEIDPDAVIVIMTGYPSAESIVETVEDDGYTYLAKPVDMEQLQDIIGRGLTVREKRIKERQAE